MKRNEGLIWQAGMASMLPMSTMLRPVRRLQRVALIGLSIGLVTNWVGFYVFHRHSSVFFSPEWWKVWYPNYLVWATLGFIGSVVRERTNAR